MKKLPVLLAATALFAAGCGGDDNDSASGARGYAETGQAISDICTRVNAETGKLAQDLDGTAKHDAPIVEKIVDAQQKYVDELKAIEPDAKLKSTFDKYVAAVEDSQSRAREAVDVAKQGDDEAYRMAVEAVDNDETTHPLARALGATDCVKS